MQGAGLPPRALGASYTNTDYLFVDETDAVDLWHHFLLARSKNAGVWDVSQMIDSRERRRVIGDYYMQPMDIILKRTYPDTICVAKSNFDTHGFTIHPLFYLQPRGHEGLAARVPYRCLLPQGVENILVTGLGMSAHRDALPVIRMQADVQNQGYAAGHAASLAIKAGKTVRQVDIEALQQHLLKIGVLTKEDVGTPDSLPMSEGKIAAAVESLTDNYDGIAVVLAHQDQAVPLMKTAYAKAEKPEAKLIYAHVLCMLGDKSAVDTLAQAVADGKWDKGWRWRGMGQFGASSSRFDSLVIALGRTRDPRAVPALVHKAAELEPDYEFSHFRAMTLAMEACGGPQCAAALARLLKLPGVGGHALPVDQATDKAAGMKTVGDAARGLALREIGLARALYHCGDVDGLGKKTLEQYAGDVRGHFARHAAAVLEQNK
jgi:hypothetical protein